ncbi:phospholipase A2 inhibitor and Ly6/PLAUR domain-containing protein-like isoform X1 [Ascaphus truei]|uniref:phospholipase A2 inhibitor and Ly6/PLAUR domain-containing protein-like isoform X1 n=1 Tax=Ascaphus truei TaxID=8439 RepID=UPI003F5A8D08
MASGFTIFCAVIATASALSCPQCITFNGRDCDSPVVNCSASHDVCMAVYTKTTAGKVSIPVFMRLCGNSKDCEQFRSVRAPGLEIISNSTCNTTEFDANVLTDTNKTVNGLVCRACLFPGSRSCYTADTIQCRGMENRCIRYATTTTLGGVFQTTFASRGCATESFCKEGIISVFSEELDIISDIACTGGSSNLSQSGGLVALIALILIKMF